MKLSNHDRATLLREFDAATPDALFDQRTPAAIRDCSLETIERDRWAGRGIPFLKIGRTVRYKKSSIVAWINSHAERQSISQQAA